MSEALSNLPARTEPKVVFGYGRGSTDKQQITVENQEERCKQYFDFHSHPGGKFEGMVWGGFYSDPGVSGKTTWFERPSGELMFRRLKEGDQIVIFKLSRASRNVFDFLQSIEKLKEHKVQVHSINDSFDMTSSHGRLMMLIFAGVAEWERETIAENTKEALGYKKRQGLPVNQGAPMGWRIEGLQKNSRFVADSKIRRWAQFVVEQFDDQKMTMKAIYEFMRKHGVRKSTGNTISPLYIRMIYCACKMGWPKNIKQDDLMLRYAISIGLPDRATLTEALSSEVDRHLRFEKNPLSTQHESHSPSHPMQHS